MRGFISKAAVFSSLIAASLCASPAAYADLKLSDVQPAYGPFWPERKSPVYYQGNDGLFVRYILNGFQPNAQGGFELSSQITLLNSAGETVKLQTLPLQGTPMFGKKCVVGYATLQFDAACVPGDYKAVVTVKDKVSGQSVSQTMPITVKAEEWAITHVGFFADPDHRVQTTLSGVVGESKGYALGIIGFDHDRVDCRIGVRILAADGEEISKHEWDKGLKREEIQPNFAAITFSNNLGGFSAPGKYRLIITAFDKLKNRTASCEFPFEIRLP
jgi:hypothetical protein